MREKDKKLQELIEKDLERKILEEATRIIKLRIHRDAKHTKSLIISFAIFAFIASYAFTFNYTGLFILTGENLTQNISIDYALNGNFTLLRENSFIPSGWFIKNSIDLTENDSLDWLEFYSNERYKKPLTEGSGFTDEYSILLTEKFLYKDAFIFSTLFSNSPTGFYNFSFYYMSETDCYSLTVSIVYFSNGEFLGYTDEVTIDEYGNFYTNEVDHVKVSISKVNDWYKVEWYPLTPRKSLGDLVTIQIRGCGFVDEINYVPV